MGILKIGVVGCGRIGKLHINNLINSVPGVQVVAAADPMLDKSGAREWLAERKCATLVSPQLLERYAMSVARWIQCEEAISDFGFLAKHPTTGNAIQSPYVAMSQNFMSQTNRLWMEIYQIVKENCATEYSGATPMDDAMERLLRARKGN